MPNSFPLTSVIVVSLFICGCAMFSAWREIPPPGGCDKCHTMPINANWHVAYNAPILSDERGEDYFKTTDYNMPRTDQPSSSLEVRKVEEQQCFKCHKAPDIAHKRRMGRFHHH